MSKAPQEMLNLALQLFAFEAKHPHTNEQAVEGVVRVCGRLRLPLTKFAGPVGYSSLLSRALALAKAEFPDLNSVSIQADGTLKGLDDPGQGSLLANQQSRENASVLIVAHLLELLVLFIGEGLMKSLLSEAWPSESFDKVDLKGEVKS